MKTLKVKSILFSLMAILTLSVFLTSCGEEDVIIQERAFDYTLFTENKDVPLGVIDFPDYIDRIESIQEKSLAIIEVINAELGTEIVIPEEIVDLLAYSGSEIKTKGLETGVFSNVDVDVLNHLGNDLQLHGFDDAISNVENYILGLDVSQKDFERYNTFLNMVKLVENSDPNMFGQELRFEECLKAVWGLLLPFIEVIEECEEEFFSFDCFKAIYELGIQLGIVWEDCF